MLLDGEGREVVAAVGYDLLRHIPPASSTSGCNPTPAIDKPDHLTKTHTKAILAETLPLFKSSALLASKLTFQTYLQYTLLRMGL
jgi:hypothetical protein